MALKRITTEDTEENTQRDTEKECNSSLCILNEKTLWLNQWLAKKRITSVMQNEHLQKHT